MSKKLYNKVKFICYRGGNMTLFLLMDLAYIMAAITRGLWLGKIFKNIDVRD